MVGHGLSSEFLINIGLRQGSAPGPLLLLVMVMQLISRKITTNDIFREMMRTDHHNLATVAESNQILHGA